MCAQRRPLGKGTQTRRQKEQGRGSVLSPADWETVGPRYSAALRVSAKHTAPETPSRCLLASLPDQRLRERFDFRSTENIKQQQQISASYNVLPPPCTLEKNQSTQGNLMSPSNTDGFSITFLRSSDTSTVLPLSLEWTRPDKKL